MIFRIHRLALIALCFLGISPMFAESIAVGSNPVYAVPHEQKLYVINADNNTVSVIDTVTKEVTATIPVGNKPLTATLSGQYLYVGNSEGSTITVIDTEQDLVDKTINIPKGVVYILSSDKYLYALGNSHITVVDINSHDILRVVANKGPVGTRFPTFLTAQNRIFIHYANDIYITVLWLTNGTMSQINIGHGHNAGAVVGKYLYTVNTFPSQLHISEVNAPQNTFVMDDGNPSVIPLGKDPVQALSLGSRIYVNNSGDNTVSVIDTTKKIIIKTIPVGANPLFMHLVGRTLFVLNNQDNTVSMIDTNTDTVVKTLSTDISPSFVTVHTGKLYVLNAKSNSVNVFDISAPQLLEFNTLEASGTYGNNSTITLRAAFDTAPAAGSSMRVTLNTNKSILLDTIQGKYLLGKYTIGPGENVDKLTVKWIDTTNIRNSSDIPGVYSIPDKKNIADLKTITIRSTGTPTTAPVCKSSGFYRFCPVTKQPDNMVEYQTDLICEGIIGGYQVQRSTKRINRYDTLSMAVSMLRVPNEQVRAYSATFEDITEPMRPLMQVALDSGLIMSTRLFEPAKPVTRIEAYTLLMKSVCLVPPQSSAAQEWTQALHETAFNAGITNKPLSRFRPSSVITKAEAFMIASRLIDWADKTGGCKPQVCSAK